MSALVSLMTSKHPFCCACTQRADHSNEAPTLFTTFQVQRYSPTTAHLPRAAQHSAVTSSTRLAMEGGSAALSFKARVADTALANSERITAVRQRAVHSQARDLHRGTYPSISVSNATDECDPLQLRSERNAIWQGIVAV